MKYIRFISTLLLFVILLSACQEKQKTMVVTESHSNNYRSTQTSNKTQHEVQSTRSIEFDVLKKISYINNEFGGIEDRREFSPSDEQTQLINNELEKYLAAFALGRVDYIKKKLFHGLISWAITESDSNVTPEEARNELAKLLLEDYKKPNFVLEDTGFLIHDITLLHQGTNMDIYGVKYMIAFKPKSGGDYYAVTTYDLAILQDSNVFFTGLTSDVFSIFRPLMDDDEYRTFMVHLKERLP